MANGHSFIELLGPGRRANLTEAERRARLAKINAAAEAFARGTIPTPISEGRWGDFGLQQAAQVPGSFATNTTMPPLLDAANVMAAVEENRQRTQPMVSEPIAAFELPPAEYERARQRHLKNIQQRRDEPGLGSTEGVTNAERAAIQGRRQGPGGYDVPASWVQRGAEGDRRELEELRLKAASDYYDQPGAIAQYRARQGALAEAMGAAPPPPAPVEMAPTPELRAAQASRDRWAQMPLMSPEALQAQKGGLVNILWGDQHIPMRHTGRGLEPDVAPTPAEYLTMQQAGRETAMAREADARASQLLDPKLQKMHREEQSLRTKLLEAQVAETDPTKKMALVAKGNMIEQAGTSIQDAITQSRNLRRDMNYHSFLDTAESLMNSLQTSDEMYGNADYKNNPYYLAAKADIDTRLRSVMPKGLMEGKTLRMEPFLGFLYTPMGAIHHQRTKEEYTNRRRRLAKFFGWNIAK